MKKFVQINISIFLTLIFGFQSVNACDISAEPLRKTFRRSKAIFLAEVKDIKLEKNSNYNEDLIDGKVTFEISDSRKGNYKNQVELAANVGFICGCDYEFEQFKVGRKYVVFVDKKSVVHFCDSQDVETERGAETAKRLDKFWFRSWASLFPF